jgi:ABC-type multidrug transport system ATPase subunit
MIHQNSLLILDEPTVGLDPLLRESIWGYLNDLVRNKGTTIIISTHYSEESSACGKIGVMRNGRLIAEASPKKLLYLTQTSSLEQTILTLCHQDEIKNDNYLIQENITHSSPLVNVQPKRAKKKKKKNNNFKANFLIVFALVSRTFILMRRHPRYILYLLHNLLLILLFIF